MDALEQGFTRVAGIEVVDIDDDRAVLRLSAGEHQLNSHGTIHGGAIATLADSAMGAAVVLPDVQPVTVELTVTYLEKAEPGPITATARVRRRGSRITIVEADITDESGTAVALAIGTFTTIG